MAKKQLFQLTRMGFELPFYIDQNGAVITTSANNIPVMLWPDGSWCFQANIYMLNLFGKGLSRKNGGGTLKTYAANISHLSRFCYKRNMDFIELDDNQFSSFIKELIRERNARNPEVLARDSNSVIRIGRICLDFLACVGGLHGDDRFIGPAGCIKAQQKVAEIPIGDNRTILKKFWYHRSFPTQDPKKVRLPISSKNIEKLRAAVLQASTSIFQRKRRYVMLKLLGITGGRRSEVAALTVESVREAAKMAEPKLRLLTAKQPGGREEYRLIPIATHDLAFLIEFIEVNRSRVIRKTCGKQKDDGRVLISENTGYGIQPNTITQEVRILAIAAGIVEKICPHMHRHTFITKLFVALIEQHNFENPDSFRRALIDTEGIKAEVLQWTGQKKIESLTPYIHMAFAEIAKLKKTLDIVRIKMTIESFKGSVDQVRSELGDKFSGVGKEAAQLLCKLADALIVDLDSATLSDDAI